MDEDAIFRGRVKEDEEICYQRAKRDLVDTRWCGEIRDAATLAYNQSSRGFDSSLLLLLYSPLLFVLIITIQNLKDQLKELKEKIDV